MTVCYPGVDLRRDLHGCLSSNIASKEQPFELRYNLCSWLLYNALKGMRGFRYAIKRSRYKSEAY